MGRLVGRGALAIAHVESNAGMLNAAAATEAMERMGRAGPGLEGGAAPEALRREVIRLRAELADRTASERYVCWLQRWRRRW